MNHKFKEVKFKQDYKIIQFLIQIIFYIFKIVMKQYNLMLVNKMHYQHQF